MSERSHPESIGSLRELRPSEDLSLLHAYELRRVFETETVASLGLVEPSGAVERESYRPISVPLATESLVPTPSVRDETISPYLESRTDASDAVEIERTPEAEVDTTQDAAANAEVPRRDWLLHPEPFLAPVEAQPYGDDPVRMRELVQWFVDGRAASASVLVQKAAGDLVEGAGTVRERPFQLRAIVASGRLG